MRSLAGLLRPGGLLLLTTPNVDYVSMDEGDSGPFLPIEDGRHVRRGYSSDDLRDLVAGADLKVSEIGYCSGFASQKITKLLRFLSRSIGYKSAWAITLPLRILPVVLDCRGFGPAVTPYSICVVAVKGEGACE